MHGWTRGGRLLAALLAVALMTVTGSADAAVHSGRFDQPYVGFAPPETVLHQGTPADAGVAAAPITDALRRIDAGTAPNETGHPTYAGSVALLVHDGVVVSRHAAGYALRYADSAGTELPAAQRVPARPDTIFDLASLTKLCTTIVVLRQVESGRVRLDGPAATYLPEFAAHGKAAITVRQLLTHTSGLAADPDPPLWQDYPDLPSRVHAVLDSTPADPPGRYRYSDLNMITLGLLAAQVTGQPLDELVRRDITAPLRMTDTRFNPPPAKLDRIAATEFETQPPRGLLRGSVHDENAWALGGVAGHAGLFGTADDLAVLGQTILNGGTYRGHRMLRPDTVRLLLTNFSDPADPAHGLGFELDQRWYMDALSGPRTAGHTGFTGTSIVLDPASRSIAILLTNRVHPSRDWGTINPARRTLARGLALALAVRAPHGSAAWFSSADSTDDVLTTGDLRIHGQSVATFDAFVDTGPAAALALESSVDGGRSWQAVSLRANGSGAPGGPVGELSGAGHRAWWEVASGTLPTGVVRLRWHCRGAVGGSAESHQAGAGRGVYVAGMRVVGGTDVGIGDDPSELRTTGWVLADR